jgi:hypothetical protein
VSNEAKGPYRATVNSKGDWFIEGDNGFKMAISNKYGHVAAMVATALNDRLTSQAARVATLMSVCHKARNALRMCVPDATILIDELNAALTPKEAT